ncbi:MAG: histidinol phosphate phosphatase [Candidatus Eisenbacteria bacterium]|nr:histidinol phosphate phosphatase [Candidatus Eisenbacteria bacterium]
MGRSPQRPPGAACANHAHADRAGSGGGFPHALHLHRIGGRGRTGPAASGRNGEVSADLRDALELAERAVRTAGQLALHHFHSGVAARRKADGSPVSDADLAAEEAMRRVLEEGMPGVPVLGEELGGASPAAPSTEARWIVDPIDGTRNFVRGIPIFASLAAFESGGRCVAGAVHAPALGDLIVAAEGAGCRWNGRPVRVSEMNVPETALVVTGGLDSLLSPRHRAAFLRLVRHTERQRGFGDYYGHFLVATGRAEAMVETKIHPWDVAPFRIIIEEAGGRFTDLSGRDSIYSGSVLATNGRLHETILRLWNNR